MKAFILSCTVVQLLVQLFTMVGGRVFSSIILIAGVLLSRHEAACCFPDVSSLSQEVETKVNFYL